MRFSASLHSHGGRRKVCHHPTFFQAPHIRAILGSCLAPRPSSFDHPRTGESPLVSSILQEAAEWLQQRGDPLWSLPEIEPDAISMDVDAGCYLLAFAGEEAVGTADLLRMTQSAGQMPCLARPPIFIAFPCVAHGQVHRIANHHELDLRSRTESRVCLSSP